jgi:hypothetical protein
MFVLLDEGGCPVARPARLWDRLLVRMRTCRLDDDLAGGASPDATVALALRAQLLVRTRTRRDLAQGARRVLATAMRAPAVDSSRAHSPDHSPASPAGRSPARAAARSLASAARGPQLPAARRSRVPICRDRVTESSEELEDLIRRLLADGPVAARGVALATILLSDGSGPLYHHANEDDVRARVREAVNALEPLTG